MSALLKLQNAKKREMRAHDDCTAACHEAFPIGAQVTYSHGRKRLSAEVIAHTPYSPRVQVRGATGAEFWLDATRLYDFDTLLAEIHAEKGKASK